jgi:hypothetical protein
LIHNVLELLNLIIAAPSAASRVRGRQQKQQLRQRQHHEACVLVKMSQLASSVLDIVRNVDGDIGVGGSSYSTSISNYSSWVPVSTPTTTVTGSTAAIAYLRSKVAVIDEFVRSTVPAAATIHCCSDDSCSNVSDVDDKAGSAGAISPAFANMVTFIATELSQ